MVGPARIIHYFVVVLTTGAAAISNSLSVTEVAQHALLDFCDMKFPTGNLAEQPHQQDPPQDGVHGLHGQDYSRTATRTSTSSYMRSSIIDVNPLDLKNMGSIGSVDRDDHLEALMWPRSTWPYCSAYDSTWDPGPPGAFDTADLSGFPRSTVPHSGSRCAAHAYASALGEPCFLECQFAYLAHLPDIVAMRDAYSHIHTCWDCPYLTVDHQLVPCGTHHPWQVPLTGGDRRRSSCRPTPAQRAFRCDEGAQVGILASCYAAVTPGILAPRCCALSLHITPHTTYLTYVTYSVPTVPIPVPVQYTEYSRQVQVTGEQRPWLEQHMEQQYATGGPPLHASSMEGLRLASIVTVPGSRWRIKHDSDLYPHLYSGDITDWIVYYYMYRKYRMSKGSTHLILGYLTLGCLTKVQGAPRSTRSAAASGSGSVPKAKDFTANMQDKWDFLPGMKRWDGIPHYDFVKIWIAALIVALGSIVQSGNTLLQCANEQDDGRDSTNDSAEDVRDHNNRKARLYACIMNYIDPTSRIHRTASENFPNDGPGLFKWLKVVGQLSLPEETKEEYRRNFDRATMSNVGIPFTPDGIFKWLNWVDENGDRGGINKSLNQKRKKFLEGFPASFDVVITPERMAGDPGSYVLPNQFPAHHPKAGQADPNRGKPDLDALARALYPEWCRRINSGLIKAVPKGSVYMADDNDCSDDDSSADGYGSDDISREMDAMAVSRGKVSAMMVCLVCGGLGHASNVDGMQCLTAQLGIKVPKHDLAKIKYPNGIKFPEWSRRPNPKRRDHGSSSSEALYTDKQRPNTKPRAKPKLSEKDKRKLRKQREAKEAREAEVEKSDSQSSSESEQEVAPESKFASVYHTIDIRSHPNKGYQSYTSSDDDDNHNLKSATTEASTP
jgi:hypothetical protein